MSYIFKEAENEALKCQSQVLKTDIQERWGSSQLRLSSTAISFFYITAEKSVFEES